MTAPTVAMLRVWLRERAGRRDEPLFPTRTGRQLTRDALARRLTKYSAQAAERSPSLLEKNVIKTIALDIPVVFSMSRVIVLAFAVAMLH